LKGEDGSLTVAAVLVLAVAGTATMLVGCATAPARSADTLSVRRAVAKQIEAKVPAGTSLNNVACSAKSMRQLTCVGDFTSPYGPGRATYHATVTPGSGRYKISPIVTIFLTHGANRSSG
jgi:hypothetical protein